MLLQQSQVPLAALDGARYRGLAYDGCHIYLTVHQASTVVQLDDCFNKTECFHTRRAYGAICYDSDECCFWATADGFPCTIYKLNKCMEEIDCIRVQTSRGGQKPITGISYRCCDHSLLVAFSEEILQVCPACPEQQSCMLKATRECFTGVLSLCPYILCTCLESTARSFCIYSESGELLHKLPAPFCSGLEAAVFWPCSPDGCECRLLILYTKNGCYPHLCDYPLDCEDLCGTLCPCNFDLCRICPHPLPPSDACSEVLQSIALMEAALSHILNAEGEKLQKVIASTSDISKIMAVNESVNQTLNNVIFLEQILCCKLEALQRCCDICPQPEPCEQ